MQNLLTVDLQRIHDLDQATIGTAIKTAVFEALRDFAVSEERHFFRLQKVVG